MRNQQTNTQDDGVPCTSQGRFDTDSSDFYDQVANWIPDCLAYMYVVNLIPGCLAVQYVVRLIPDCLVSYVAKPIRDSWFKYHSVPFDLTGSGT